MGAFFVILYALHPMAPVVVLLVMANGVLAPALLHSLAGVPLDIRAVRQLAKSGNQAAVYAYYSWLTFAAAGVALVVVVVAAKL